jgi:hypothetical protein
LASQLEIRVLFNDGYVDPGVGAAGTIPGGVQTQTPANFPPDDLVDGTLTVSASTLYATGIMVPASQLFTVVQPIVTVGAVIVS